MATEIAIESAATASDAARTEAPVSAFTLPLYLLGNRLAIVRLAESRAALWVGLLFVLSAGLAREYDGADLLHQPWHLALPLVASLGTSLMLYALVFIAARNRGVKVLPFVDGYRTLLTFYWWTAPLAWLYAIPVERFLSPGDATAANLWLLAAVSVWRVLLITRAVSVWLDAGFIAMFFIVMFFADTVAVLLAFISPKPIFNIMGGVRLSEPDRVVLDTMLTVMFLGGLSWFLWLIAAGVVIGKRTPAWRLATSSAGERRVSKPLWVVAALFLAVGISILPIGQREQQNRWRAEHFLRAGDLEHAVHYVSQFPRADFPPVWDPPPRLGFGEDRPPVLDVLESIEAHGAAQWFRELYVDKFSQDPSNLLREAMPDEDDPDTSEFERILSVLEKNVPAKTFERMEEWYELRSIAEDDRVDARLRERLTKYLETKSSASN
jgi:hypothetical protein